MIQLIFVMFVIMTFSFIGFGFVVSYFINKLKALQKPRTPLRADKKKIEEFTELTKGLSFEEKLFAIRTLLGNYRCYISVDDNQVVIQALGRTLEDIREPPDYTG